eukprot:3309214-Pyramimonas_sp.AAC.2
MAVTMLGSICAAIDRCATAACLPPYFYLATSGDATTRRQERAEPTCAREDWCAPVSRLILT